MKDGFNHFTFIISPLFSKHKCSLYPTALRRASLHAWQPPTLGLNPGTLSAWCPLTKQRPTILICRTENILRDDVPVIRLNEIPNKFNGLDFVFSGGFVLWVGFCLFVCFKINLLGFWLQKPPHICIKNNKSQHSETVTDAPFYSASMTVSILR